MVQSIFISRVAAAFYGHNCHLGFAAWFKHFFCDLVIFTESSNVKVIEMMKAIIINTFDSLHDHRTSFPAKTTKISLHPNRFKERCGQFLTAGIIIATPVLFCSVSRKVGKTCVVVTSLILLKCFLMMMIAFTTIKSSLVPLIEGLCAQIYFRFEISVVCSHLLLFFFVKGKTC